MAENLLVNIDVDTKRAKRGVDDLTKSLSQNTKQTKKIQEELRKLEKEYKSIATAAKKLPVNEASRLTKEVKKAEKATARLENQFERTAGKLERVRDRTVDAEEAFGVLTATMVGFATLRTPILFTGQIVKATHEIRKFVATVAPAVSAAKRLTTIGFGKVSESVILFKEALQALGPAVREQIMLMRGYQVVTVQTGQFLTKFEASLKTLGGGASRIRRAMVGLVETWNVMRETGIRVARVFRTIGDGIVTTTKIVGEFERAFASTFGGRSVGAAQVSRFRQMLLEIQYASEVVGESIRSKLSTGIKVAGAAIKNFSTVAVQSFREFLVVSGSVIKDLGSRLGPALIDIGKRVVPLLSKGLQAAGPVFSALSLQAGKLFTVINIQGAAAFAKAGEGIISFASSVVDLSRKMGVIGSGFFRSLEAGQLFGVGMLGLGTILKGTDNAVLDFIGSVVQMAGILSLTFVGALTLVTSAVGHFLVVAGDKLAAVMDGWEKKFAKAQQVAMAFEFTIRGFGKTLGEVATGSLDFWNQQIGEMAESTTFASTEVQKSIKILIAEGQALGLTASQNAQILKRAGDIAAATGNNLADVSLGIAKALAGNSAALQSVGIFTDNATVAHSKFSHAQGKSIESLNRHEKAIHVMNSIFEQSTPLIGAAEDQVNSITGANDQLTRSIESLEARLGSQNVFFTKLVQAQNTVVQGFLKMPAVITDTIGTLVDILSVTFKVVGTFLTFAVTLSTLKGAIELLNLAITRSKTVQLAFNFLTGVASKQLGIQTVAVVNLRTALIATTKIAFAGIIKAMGQMAASAAAATVKMAAFAATILTNPLFIAGAAIVGAVFIARDAFAELRTEVAAFDKTLVGNIGTLGAATPAYLKLAGVSGELGDATKALNKIGTAFKITWEGIHGFLKNIFKIVLLDLAGAFNIVFSSVLRVKRLFADASEARDLSILIKDMDKDGKALANTSENIRAGLGAMAIAADGASASVKKLKDDSFVLINGLVTLERRMAETNATVKDLKDGAAGLDTAFNVDFILDPFDKAISEVQRSQKEIQKATKESFDVFKEIFGEDVASRMEKVFSASPAQVLETAIGKLKKGTEEQIKEAEKLKTVMDKVASAESKQEAARIGLSNLRIQTQRQLVDLQKQSQKEVLQSQKQGLDLIKLENAERLKQFDIQSKQVLSIITSTRAMRDTKKIIEETRAALVERNSAALSAAVIESGKQAAETAKEQLTTIQQLADAFNKLNTEVLAGGGDQEAIAQVNLGLRMQEIEALKQALEAQAAFTDGAGNLQKGYADALAQAQELAKQKFVADLDKAAFLSQFIEAIDAIPAERLGGKVVKGLIKGTAQAGKLIQGAFEVGGDLFAGAKDIFKGVDFSKGFESLGSLTNLGSDIAGSLGKAAAGLGKKIFTKDNMLSAGTFLAEKLIQGADLITSMFDPAVINNLADSLSEGVAKLPEMLTKAFNSLLSAMDRVIEKLPEALTKFLDALPGIFSKILAKLPELINVIFDALIKLLDQLPAILGQVLEALPGILAQIMERLPELIDSLLQAIPAIISKIIAVIPDLIVVFLEKIPEILESLVGGLIGAMGEIGAAFVDFLIGGGLEKIVVAFLKAIPRIALALVKGIITGLARSFGALFGKVSIPQDKIKDMGDKVGKSIGGALKKVTGEASKLFGVKDLEDAAKGNTAAVQTAKLAEMILDNFTMGANLWQRLLAFLKKIWDGVIGFFKKLGGLVAKAWKGIMEFFQNFGRLISDAWKGIMQLFQNLGELVQKAFGGIITFFTEVFGFLVNEVFGPITKFFGEVFGGIVDGVFKPVVSFFQNSFFSTITQAFKPVVDTFKTMVSIYQQSFGVLVDFFKNIFKGNVKEAFQGVFDFFTNSLKRLLDAAFQGPLKKIGDAGKAVVDKIGETIGTVHEKFMALGGKIFEGLKTALGKVGALFTNLGAGIFQGLKDAVGKVGSIFSDLGSSIFDGLKTMLTSPGKGLAKIMQGIFDTLNPLSILKKIFSMSGESSGKGTVEKVINLDVPFVNFATGGKVPGRALTPGDSLKNDRVPAMLSPGEFVIPRTIAQDPFIHDLLQAIMGGTLKGFAFGAGDLKKAVGGGGKKGGGINIGGKDGISIGGDGVSIGGKNGISIGSKGGISIGGVGIDPAGAINEKMEKALRNMMKLHTGGMVPGMAAGGDVPAMLQPGEFVVNRSAVQALGANVMNRINKGSMPAGDTTVSINMQFDVKEKLDEAFVRQRLMPTVKKEIKDASLRGEFLMSQRGIREA